MKQSTYRQSQRNQVGGCDAHLVAEEAARDVDLLAANDDNLLAIEDLLGDDGGQATKQMALAVDDDGGGGERCGGHGESGKTRGEEFRPRSPENARVRTCTAQTERSGALVRTDTTARVRGSADLEGRRGAWTVDLAEERV
jgi:hypothetical protein